MKLLLTPKITYKKEAPNPDYVFSTHLTAQYCSADKHPDASNWPINKTENVAECIDHLTGCEVGSSFSPDNYPVATYHMINSANKLFDHQENYHQGFYDALNELSIKINTNNLKQLQLPPSPPPPPKTNIFNIIVLAVAEISILAASFVLAAPLVAEAEVVGEIVETTVVKISEISAEVDAAEDVIEISAEGSISRNAAVEFRNKAEASSVSEIGDELSKQYSLLKGKALDNFLSFFMEDLYYGNLQDSI